jgi:hypothetical protein
LVGWLVAEYRRSHRVGAKDVLNVISVPLWMYKLRMELQVTTSQIGSFEIGISEGVVRSLSSEEIPWKSDMWENQLSRPYSV